MSDPNATVKHSISSSQVEALGKELIAVATIFNPVQAAAIGGLVQVAFQLNAMIGKIKNGVTPEVWAEVVEQNKLAVKHFEDSVAAHPGR